MKIDSTDSVTSFDSPSSPLGNEEKSIMTTKKTTGLSGLNYTPYKPVNITGQAKKAYNYYLNRGIKANVAAGIVGNLYKESGLNPTAIGDKGTAFGVAQWRGDRLSNLKNYASSKGKSHADLTTQLDFILDEKGENQVLSLMGNQSPEVAAKTFADKYERPNPQYADYSTRSSVAKQLGKMKLGGFVPKYALGAGELMGLVSQGMNLGAGFIDSTNNQENPNVAKSAISGFLKGNAALPGIGGILGGISGIRDAKKQRELFQKKKDIENRGVMDYFNIRSKGILDNYNTQGEQGSFYAKGGIPNPQYEVEHGEVIVGDDVKLTGGKQIASNLHKVIGKTHDQSNPNTVNGTGEDGQGGQFIFSNRLQLGGKTFAKLAEKVAKEKSKAEEMMAHNDYIFKNTGQANAEIADAKLQQLAQIQEMMKEEANPVGQFKFGGSVSKYPNGDKLKSLDDNYFDKWYRKGRVGQLVNSTKDVYQKIKNDGKNLYNVFDKQYPTNEDKLSAITNLTGYVPNPYIAIPSAIINTGLDIAGLENKSNAIDLASTVMQKGLKKRTTPLKIAGKVISSTMDLGNPSNEQLDNKFKITKKALGGSIPQYVGGGDLTAEQAYEQAYKNLERAAKARATKATNLAAKKAADVAYEAAYKAEQELAKKVGKEVTSKVASRLGTIVGEGLYGAAKIARVGTAVGALATELAGDKSPTQSKPKEKPISPSVLANLQKQGFTPNSITGSIQQRRAARNAALNPNTQTIEERRTLRNSPTTPQRTNTGSGNKLNLNKNKVNPVVDNLVRNQFNTLNPLSTRQIDSSVKLPDVSNRVDASKVVPPIRKIDNTTASNENFSPVIGAALSGINYFANQNMINKYKTQTPATLLQNPNYQYFDRSGSARNSVRGITNTIMNNPFVNQGTKQAALANSMNVMNDVNQQELNRKQEYDRSYRGQQLDTENRNTLILNQARQQAMQNENQKQGMKQDNLNNLFSNVNTNLAEFQANKQQDKAMQYMSLPYFKRVGLLTPEQQAQFMKNPNSFLMGQNESEVPKNKKGGRIKMKYC